jgi:tropomyosin
MADRIREVCLSDQNRCLVKPTLVCFQKMNQLRTEADNAVARAEEAETKNKKYDQILLEKDQEITSLQHRLHLLDEELEKAEASLKESKVARDEGEKAKGEYETSSRKIQLLEGELDKAEGMLKDTVEKFVSLYCCC